LTELGVELRARESGIKPGLLSGSRAARKAAEKTPNRQTLSGKTGFWITEKTTFWMCVQVNPRISKGNGIVFFCGFIPLALLRARASG
jgi:hypothetical protein